MKKIYLDQASTSFPKAPSYESCQYSCHVQFFTFLLCEDRIAISENNAISPDHQNVKSCVSTPADIFLVLCTLLDLSAELFEINGYNKCKYVYN